MAGIGLTALAVRVASGGATAEEALMRETLERAGRESIAASLQEYRVVTSLLNSYRAVSPQGSGLEDIERALQFWRTNTRFPQIVESVHVIRGQGDGAWTFDGVQLVPVEDADDQFSVSAGDGVVIPLLQQSGIVGFISVRFRMSLLYTELLPHFLGETLPGVPWRVLDPAEQQLASSLIDGIDYLPEAVLEISPRAARRAFSQAPDPLPVDDADILDFSPQIISWYERSRGVGIAELAAEPASVGHLELYNVNQPLHAAARRSRILTAALGIAITWVLVAATMATLVLYHRSGLMRRRQQEITAAVTHELRTPVAVIQSLSDNLTHGLVTDSARRERYARLIHEQSKRLELLVESMLAYAGLTARATATPREVALPAEIQHTIESLAELAKDRGYTLVFAMHPPTAAVTIDPLGLRLITENLVMNALVHAVPGRIDVIFRAREEQLTILVADEGPGIAAHEQRRIFAPFVRMRSASKLDAGIGLGLYLTRRKARALGGSVGVESPYRVDGSREMRAGTRFVVALPITSVRSEHGAENSQGDGSLSERHVSGR